MFATAFWDFFYENKFWFLIMQDVIVLEMRWNIHIDFSRHFLPFGNEFWPRSNGKWPIWYIFPKSENFQCGIHVPKPFSHYSSKIHNDLGYLRLLLLVYIKALANVLKTMVVTCFATVYMSKCHKFFHFYQTLDSKSDTLKNPRHNSIVN